MKKLILSAGLAVAAISCSNDETMVVNPQMPEMPAMRTAASIRSIDEAAQIASDAIGMLPTSGSRSVGRTFDKKNVKFGVNAGSRAGNDTLMYVFNFDNNEGFAVVAANRNVDGLIAVTELGSYDPNSIPENPGLAIYMQNVKEELAELSVEAESDTLQLIIDPTKPNYPPGLMEYKIVHDTIYRYEILPNYGLRWGQRMPEGLECPNGIAGCTNIALFMIMSYFEYPSSMTLSYLDEDTSINIDWATIKNHKQSYNNASDFESYICLGMMQHDNIAKICRELGNRNRSSYKSNTTSTSHFYLLETISSLGFNSSEILDEVNVMSELSSGAKLYASGFDYNEITNKRIGHSWIIDGVKYYEIQTSEWTRPVGTAIWHKVNDCGEYTSTLHHINWGWNGIANGYHTPGNFDSSTPTYPADTPNVGSYSFTEDFGYVVISR